MFVAYFSGLIAGTVHVVSGPDHLAAVAPLAASHPSRAAFRGVLWGLGHTLAVGIIAFLAVLFRDALPLEALSHGSERVVGLLLIGLGLWTLRSAFRNHFHVHAHRHEHDGVTHSHLHVHRSGHDESRAQPSHSHGHAAFGVGALHGLAGSAHVLAVLPALALPDRVSVAAYLGGYGTAAVLAMAVFSWGIGRLSQSAANASGQLYKRLLTTTGVAAIAVGAFWLVS